MSARSAGGCLGTQGGGCALVILSISSAKIFKVSIKYSEYDYLQSRCGKGRTSEKWTESVDVRLSSVRSLGAAVTLRSGLGGLSSEAPGCDLWVGLCLRPAYVLNTPCDSRHVSQLRTQTLHRHMSLTCWTALSTPHPPHAAWHAHARRHTHSRLLPCVLLEYIPPL